MMFYLIARVSLCDVHISFMELFLPLLCAELDTADDYEGDAAVKQADVNCDQQVDTVEQVRYSIVVVSHTSHFVRDADYVCFILYEQYTQRIVY